jgi:DNA-directed RNA polymerase specialized sigma24 family protein
MQNIDWNKHYNAFKWAVSKNWKHRNGLHRSIQGKIETLVQEYDLSEKDIVDDLFEDYWERGHYLKFDETKGSLNNWIAGYVSFYLNNLIRRYAVRAKNAPCKNIDPLDQRNWANLEWIDQDNEKEDLDYKPEIVFDPTNPENLLIAKETLDFIHGHFRENEIAYLMGEMDLEEAAEVSGCSHEAFRRNLDRRKADFVNAMKAVHC